MSAPKGNQYALKTPGERRDDILHVRCRKADKDLFRRAAKIRAARDPKMSAELTDWVLDVLKAEADWEIQHKKEIIKCRAE
jgi:uncharacterized protein (DUF1778 family)